MPETLSQTEIDALLSAVSNGDVPEEKAGKTGKNKKDGSFDWVAYDLSSQEKFLKGRLVALEGIHERFCRLLRAALISSFDKQVSVTYKDTEVMRFGEYMLGVTLPTSLNVINMKNPSGHMLFVVGARLAYALVDAYYGGSERSFSQIGLRDEFTTIEKKLIRRTIDIAIDELRASWKPNYPIELEYMTAEPNPVFVSYIHANESVAIINFEVEFENNAGVLSLVIHLRSLDPIRKFLSVNVTKEISGDKQLWQRHWLKEIQNLEINLKASLGTNETTLEKINNWKVGDVITLDQDPLSPVIVEAEGIAKFEGQMGAFHGSSAVKISNVIKKSVR